MKITFTLILFMLIVIIPAYAINVDKEIEDKLEQDNEVSVIVILKEKPMKEAGIGGKASVLANKKSMIKEQQKKVLDKLNVDTKIKTKSLHSEVFDLKLAHKYSTINGFSGEITKQGLEKLKQDPNVASIHINGIKKILLAESVPLINGDDVWKLKLNNTNITGRGETICVIDTGIDTDHAAFDNRILDQYCYCGRSGGCCPDSSSEDNDAEDDEGHGTHVTGIAAGNYSSTIKGVAPEAGIISIKVCDSSGLCNDDDIIAGIEWCTNNASKYNISVISLSLGDDSTTYNTYCDANETPTAAAINSAVAQNISVMVASGNNGWTNGITSPSCIENATPVGAVDSSDVITYNRGSILDLLAPGISIESSYNNGGTDTFSGTSQATPHVSGAALLLRQFVKAQNGSILTPFEIEDVLNRTGKSIDDSGGSGKNYSRINVLAAIISLDSSPPTITFVDSTPVNKTIQKSENVTINITSNEILSTALLEWDNINITMNGSGTNWYINKTDYGAHYYRVWGNDSAGNFGVSETRNITLNSSGCVSATNNMNIAENTTFCQDTYNLANGITIGADNIVLDCNRTRLIGTDQILSSGIRVDGRNNVVIKNCKIEKYNYTGYAYGIRIQSSSNIDLDRNNISNNQYGIILSSSSDNIIRNNNISNNNYCIRLEDSFNNSLINNTFDSNKFFCIDFSSSSNNTFISNNVKSNSYGIYLSNSHNNNISYNEIHDSTQSGVKLYYSSDNTIEYNNIHDNNNYNLFNNQNYNVSAENNYWGTTNGTAINNSIYDFYNDNSLGIVDYNPWYLDSTYTTDSDSDNDGYSNSSLGGSDCNDANASIKPNATELRNLVDDNCNGIVDDGFTIGNASNINTTTITPNVTISGSTNLTQQFNETQNLTIKNNATIILEFKFNFTSNSLNFSNITIEKQNSTQNFGALLIKGISVQPQTTKTIYIDNVTYYQGICIRDEEVNSINNISDNCNETNENFVDCPGSRGQYNCTINGTRFKITGLNHSATKQSNDTQAPVIISYSPTTTTSTTTTLTITTDENATCRYSTTNGTNYSSMTNSFTDSDTTHTASVSTSSSGTYSFYVRCNDSYGNINTVDYNANITATISPPGGGGGGGGSRTIIQTCTENWKCTSWIPATCPPNLIQSRDCTDLNNCSTTLNKPAEIQTCFRKEPIKEENLTETSQDELVTTQSEPVEQYEKINETKREDQIDKFVISPVIYLPIILILIIIILLVLTKKSHKKKKLKKALEKAPKAPEKPHLKKKHKKHYKKKKSKKK